MAKMTGARLFANMMQGYEVSHIFFVPAFMLKSFAEMEDMPIKRIMVHGEKAAADVATLNACRSKPGHSGAARRAGDALRRAMLMNKPVVLDVVTDMYAIAPHPWTPSGRDFHAYQRTGA